VVAPSTTAVPGDEQRAITVRDEYAATADSWWRLTLSDVLGLALTIVVAIITGLQVNRMTAANQHVRVVERAYVSISVGPPGVVSLVDDGEKTELRPGLIRGRPWLVKIALTNHGQTPADLLSIKVSRVVGTDLKSGQPSSDPARSVEPYAVLMPSQTAQYSANIPPVQDGFFTLVESGIGKLFVMIQVDYLDRFGSIHRVGYTRQYSHIPRPGVTDNLDTYPVDVFGFNFETDLADAETDGGHQHEALYQQK
jgi:hypothetical protein